MSDTGVRALGDFAHDGISRDRRGRRATLSASCVLAVAIAGCSSTAHPSKSTATSASVATSASASTSTSAPPSTGATPSNSAGTAGSVTVAVLAPYTGADALIGPHQMIGCQVAEQAINAAGGVLNHHLACKAVDTRGDPADAVPATRQMLASTSNLALVAGITSDEASSVVPLLNAAKKVMFVVTGQSEFDQSTFSYLYRLNPPDTEEATADVAIAKSKGFTRVALVFGNDIGSQSFVGPAEKALTTAGITLADSESLNLSAPSFRTEVAKVLASHPDAILTETVGPAAASFFSELKAQNGGKLLPMVSSSNGTNPDWYDAVSKAVGAAELSRVFSADTLHVDLSGAAYDGYVAALVASNASPAAKLDYYKSSPYTIRVYDAAVLCALAMTDAKSIDPAIYQSHIKAIAAGGAGAVDVETYAAGLAALAQGQKIHYIGASGAINFNQYNNNAGTYQIVGVSLTGATTIEGQISPTEIATLKGSGG